jgi:hypothetical protein
MRLFNQKEGTMLKLIKIEDGQFVVYNSGCAKAYIGTLADAIETLELLDIRADEIDDSLRDMNNKGHNTAVFGIDRTFIYSEYDQNLAYGKTA